MKAKSIKTARQLAAALLGKAGGQARARQRSKAELSAIGKQGAASRWKKNVSESSPKVMPDPAA